MKATGRTDKEGALNVIKSQNNCSESGNPPKLHCDTRETTVVYSAPATGNTAFVRPKLARGAGPAVGARLKVTAPGHVRFHIVPSAQGFQSQNSFWVPLSLGQHTTAELEVTWLGGKRSVVQIHAGERIVVQEGTMKAPDTDL